VRQVTLERHGQASATPRADKGTQRGAPQPAAVLLAKAALWMSPTLAIGPRPEQARERRALTRSHPRETGGAAPGFQNRRSKMAAATFGGWLGGALGHTSVAASLGGVARWVGCRKLSSGTRPIISPIFRDCA
jgi:hypothetical protein